MDTRIDSRQQGGPASRGIRVTAWLLLATIMAAAAALLGATPALAVIKEAEYRVVIDATAHWKLARKIEERVGSNYSRVQIEATAHFDATIENVLFRDGKLITDGHWGKAHFNLNGSGDTNYFRWVTNPQPPHFETQHGFCNAQDDRFGAGTASISRWPEDYDPARGSGYACGSPSGHSGVSTARWGRTSGSTSCARTGRSTPSTPTSICRRRPSAPG